MRHKALSLLRAPGSDCGGIFATEWAKKPQTNTPISPHPTLLTHEPCIRSYRETVGVRVMLHARVKHPEAHVPGTLYKGHVELTEG